MPFKEGIASEKGDESRLVRFRISNSQLKETASTLLHIQA